MTFQSLLQERTGMKIREMHKEGRRVKVKKMLIQERGKYSAHCFLEGNDEYYYAASFKTILGNYRPYQCGGRDVVLNIMKDAEENNYAEEFDSCPLFFVDCDFISCGSNSDRLWVTTGYSIENYYCLPQTVERILRTEGNLEGEVIEEVLNYYLKMYNDFLYKSAPLNAWAKMQRILENKVGKRHQIKLCDINLKNLIEIDEKYEVTVNFNPENVELENALPISTDMQMYTTLLNEMTTAKSKELSFRGKYNLTFLIVWFGWLRQMHKNKTGPFHKSALQGKLKVRDTGVKGAIKEWATFAVTEDSLNHFLNKWGEARPTNL